ncbi:hypothetical protein J1TS3_23910 [Siminovitchia fordii]|uniref:Histidine kinase/HSP90-like ATPase domain-containing protein n=2 Tax=Siminovitchia fordii TaxID=254759 RepID=A0ABQ4K7R9_9BACI|nr:hypothetical protein J1TS3_23910 [Siminovitchia fordii]
MEQVVKNLISNAPKHAKTCEISLRLFYIYNSDNDQVILAVTDSGQGISEEACRLYLTDYTQNQLKNNLT